MPELKPRFADLDQSSAAGRFPLKGAAILIAQLPTSATLRLQGAWHKSDQLQQLVGLAWPAPGRYERNGGKVLAWAGPDEWMLLSELEEEDRLTAALSAVPTALATIVSMSDSRIGFQISGPAADDLIAKGCALDTRASAMSGQSVSITRFAGITGVVLCAPDGWNIYFDTSYKSYIASWLLDAGAEYV